jgi:hypothetical protein
MAQVSKAMIQGLSYEALKVSEDSSLGMESRAWRSSCSSADRRLGGVSSIYGAVV